MKTAITSGYTFTPGTRVLDFTGYAGFDVKRLLGVVNATAGKLIYAPGLSGLGYTALAGSALTLAFDTTAMSAADKLLVFYDDAAVAQVTADAGLGTDGTSPPTLPGGATGVRGWLRYLASLLPASLGAKTSAQSLSVTLATDGAVALGAGSAVVGKVALQVGGSDVSATAPLPTRERGISGKVRDFAAGDADGAAGRFFRVNCTLAGNVVAKLADGSTEIVPVQVGYQAFPYEVVSVANSAGGTTATATYANLN